MRNIVEFIKESLEDFGFKDTTKTSKFEIAAAAFYLASVLPKDEWKDFHTFIKKWGYGKELTRWSDSVWNMGEKVPDGAGLILFIRNKFKPESIEDIFSQMYSYEWYYVDNMPKWSDQSADGVYTCFGMGKPISYDGRINKTKITSWRQFSWDSKEDVWRLKTTKQKQMTSRYIYFKTKGMEYKPVVLPYDEVLAASQNETFVDEFTNALENEFKSLSDDAERYNKLQDRLKKEFERRKLFRSLWSPGGIKEQLDSITGGHAMDILKLLKHEMGDFASTFNVPKDIQDRICDEYRDDIEDEQLLRKWMTMDGYHAADKYFAPKRTLKARRIDVVSQADNNKK